MYGFVEEALNAYVLSLPDGKEKLDLIRREANVTHTAVNFHHAYSDEHTLNMVVSAAKVLGIDAEECLSQIGFFQVGVLVEKGYLPLVQSLGDNFYELLLHLDSMHLNIVNAYPSMKGPSFKPHRQKDGSLLLHYYSSRMGIYPYAIALLKDIAKKVYSLDIELKHVKKKGQDHDHDVFHIFMGPEGYGEKEYFDSEKAHAISGQLTFGPSMVDSVFPWHISFDRTFTITSVGPRLKERLPAGGVGQPFFRLMRVVRPDIRGLGFDSLLESFDHSPLLVQACAVPPGSDASTAPPSGCPFAAAAARTTGSATTPKPNQTRRRRGNSVSQSTSAGSSSTSSSSSNSDTAEANKNKSAQGSGVNDDTALPGVFPDDGGKDPISGITILKDGLFLKGELVFSPEHDAMLFLCIPTISSLEEMEKLDICLEDIPIHSNGRELVISTAHQSATVLMAQTLQNTTASLDKAMEDLDKEKERVDGLLHSILPTQVAQALKAGEIPEPEHYEAVSILFSDIVSFTKISSSVPVREVMDMLNELFSKFDALCTKHGVYKVETIGDAYMVASGLPKADPRHADVIAAFAVEMVAAAETVISPMDGEPINIRVGMHSGRIMAGVVGRERPRYCLFGDTVNVASRMESTGVGGAVQVSYAFIKALPNKDDWNILKRGTVPVKGKGEMKTFFVLGRAGSSMQLAPPDASDYESEAQTPRIAFGHAGSDPRSPASYGFMPQPQHQQQPVPASPAPQARQLPPPPKPDTMFEVVVHGSDIDIKLPYVPSSMTLGELMLEIHPEGTRDNADSDYRFYLDDMHEGMLLPRLTVEQLYASLVTNKVIESGSRQLSLYAETRTCLKHPFATPRIQTRAPSIPNIAVAPSNEFI
ncbi:hypothetical protein PTSG_00667 [Salpingoeca rosetta]|uniref:guanylate cyclase n=1 Tax=Salpingoeca rosetta (strain ATCC 50818 / BSB-021) TaxID=946362 RepID=F2TX50_SALR5|nr:uncharacterized protein PTSG_00667 [Salpingoeca rosetta]EGD75959.1 hypothetical protein PTSG_00667 [Salpingoeca rosetta]|eukprot:XP_004998135.1 hypothetical protein PTSG_00667 [Salpingoeca rosetta]